MPLFPYLFSLCEPKTSCSFIQSLKKKKKERKKPLAIPFPAAHGEGQTLSDISAGRQGGRFFPMGWRLPPYFQNTPLPKNTPSGRAAQRELSASANAHIPSFSFYTQWPEKGTRVWGVRTTNVCVAPVGLEVASLSSLTLLVRLPNQPL